MPARHRPLRLPGAAPPKSAPRGERDKLHICKNVLNDRKRKPELTAYGQIKHSRRILSDAAKRHIRTANARKGRHKHIKSVSFASLHIEICVNFQLWQKK